VHRGGGDEFVDTDDEDEFAHEDEDSTIFEGDCFYEVTGEDIRDEMTRMRAYSGAVGAMF
jgi:hypothetical protein